MYFSKSPAAKHQTLPWAGNLLLNFFNLQTKKPSKFSTCG